MGEEGRFGRCFLKAWAGAAWLGVSVGETPGEVEMVPVPAESLCATGHRALSPHPVPWRELVVFVTDTPRGSFKLFKRLLSQGFLCLYFHRLGRRNLAPSGSSGAWAGEGLPRPGCCPGCLLGHLLLPSTSPTRSPAPSGSSPAALGEGRPLQPPLP